MCEDLTRFTITECTEEWMFCVVKFMRKMRKTSQCVASNMLWGILLAFQSKSNTGNTTTLHFYLVGGLILSISLLIDEVNECIFQFEPTLAGLPISMNRIIPTALKTLRP